MVSINENRITAEKKHRSGCVNSSQILCRQDKAGPVVTCATSVVLSSDNEARMWHAFISWSRTTLPWSTACDSGTTPKIHCSAKEEKNISYGWKCGHCYATRAAFFFYFLRSRPCESGSNVKTGQISKLLSQLCMSHVCNLSRNVGSPAQGSRADLWPASAQQSDLRACLIFTRSPQRHRGGNWCQHSLAECSSFQFSLIAAEVPPSEARWGKHLVLIAHSLCVNMGVGKQGTSGGKWLVQVVISWLSLGAGELCCHLPAGIIRARTSGQTTS